MKHPSYFASVGLDFPTSMASALKANQLDSRDARVFVQCFEVGPLLALSNLTKAKLVQLIDSEGGPADMPNVRYARMVTPAGLFAIATYAQGIGPDKSMVAPTDGKDLLPPTDLVKNAHAVGLKVHPWTVRAENYFLPTSLQRGAAGPTHPREHGDVAAMFRALYDAGVDGVFSDFPGLAVAARKDMFG
jgi:glycerophosphoryl diester phosphodiesterase